MTFSPKGERLAVSHQADGGGSVWDWQKGILLCSLPRGAEGGKPRWSPDEYRIFVSGYGGPSLFESAHGRQIWKASGTRASVMQPAFEQLATAEFNGDVILRDVADAKPEGRKLRHDQAVRTIAYSPKGDLLATASHDQFARLWRVSDRTMIGTAMRHDDPIARLVFTPNGAMLATQTENGTVRLWDAATAQPLTVPWRHSGGLCDLFFENDGERLVAAVDHGAVYLHEVPLLPRSAPEWLPKLAEAVARQGVDESGELSRAKLPDLTALRARAETIPATEPYGRWLHWFFADRATRSISASSEKPMTAGIDELISGPVAQDDLEEARRRRPLDPKLMERLAAEYRQRREPAFAAHADFLSALAAWNAGDVENRIQAARKRMLSKIFDEHGIPVRDPRVPSAPARLDLRLQRPPGSVLSLSRQPMELP